MYINCYNTKGGTIVRRCIRCDSEMVEGLEIRDPMYCNMLRVTKAEATGALPKDRFGDIKAAVCPQCGYVETYLSRLDKIQQYKKDR